LPALVASDRPMAEKPPKVGECRHIVNILDRIIDPRI